MPLAGYGLVENIVTYTKASSSGVVLSVIFHRIHEHSQRTSSGVYFSLNLVHDFINGIHRRHVVLQWKVTQNIGSIVVLELHSHMVYIVAEMSGKWYECVAYGNRHHHHHHSHTAHMDHCSQQ